MDERLLTIKDLCNLAQLKESRVRSAIFKKELKFLKIGRLIRFRKTDVYSWLKSLEVSNEK